MTFSLLDKKNIQECKKKNKNKINYAKVWMFQGQMNWQNIKRHKRILKQNYCSHESSTHMMFFIPWAPPDALWTHSLLSAKTKERHENLIWVSVSGAKLIRLPSPTPVLQWAHSICSCRGNSSTSGAATSSLLK